MEETEARSMTGQEELDSVDMKTKAGLSDLLGQVIHAVKESGWKNERAKNNNAYVPTMKEHVANILTHGVRHKHKFVFNSVKLQIVKLRFRSLEFSLEFSLGV